MRRNDFAQTIAVARFSPRLRNGEFIRRLRLETEAEYIQSAAYDALQDRTVLGRFGVEFNSSDDIQVSIERTFERLSSAFPIAPRVSVPAGDYRATKVTATYVMATQRPLNGTLTVSRGSFYEGTRTSTSYNGRYGVSPNLAIEPTMSLNWVDLPFGDFTTHLAGTRLIVTPTPRLSFSTLIQFNASARTLASSVRMRWEYSPGSEAFAVYSDGRDTSTRGFPSLQNRTLAVKITRLLRL